MQQPPFTSNEFPQVGQRVSVVALVAAEKDLLLHPDALAYLQGRAAGLQGTIYGPVSTQLGIWLVEHASGTLAVYAANELAPA